MPTETDLVELLHAIGDRTPDADDTLDALSPRLRTAAPVHRARRLLAVAATVVAVTGVGIGSAVVLHAAGGTNTAAGVTDAEPTTNHETYELPLDRYYASYSQMTTLLRAQDLLVRRCAQTRGAVLPPSVGVSHDGATERFVQRIADDVRPLTIRQARSFGYDTVPDGRLDGVVTGRSTVEQMVVWRQCGKIASRRLLHGAVPAPWPHGEPPPGSVDDDDSYVETFYIAEARAHSNTSAVAHAQRRWSDCMAAHGYPGLASTVTAIARQNSSHSAAAKRQAVQDVTCKEATGFMTVWVDALREAQRAVIAKHRTALAGFEKRLKIRLANAARVLDQP